MIPGHYIKGNQIYNISLHFPKDFLSSLRPKFSTFSIFGGKIKRFGLRLEMLKILVSDLKFHSESLGKWKGVL